MAGNIEAKIINGLMEHFRGVPLGGAEVAYPNVDFSPSGAPYVRLSVVKNSVSSPHISDAGAVRMGLLMASVCWPVGKGIVSASELAGAIRDHFALNGEDRRVIEHDGIEIHIGVDEAPSVKGDIQGPVYTEIPVVIPWHVYQ